MQVTHIKTTDRYSFSKLTLSNKTSSGYLKCNGLLTVYLYDGEADLEIKKGKNPESISIKKGEGFVLTPGIYYRVSTPFNAEAFQVYTEVNPEKPIIQIIDDGYTKKEVVLEGCKIIKSPKIVEKPWGHELWIIWTKDYYVLKKIAMKEGNRSSLQFHRKKLETNFLIKGQADVIKGYKLDKNLPESSLQQIISGIDLSDYRQSLDAGMQWTSYPGDVHRVISMKDYIAYEVSTPELDDVIRLHDDSGRNSGRIDTEHKR